MPDKDWQEDCRDPGKGRLFWDDVYGYHEFAEGVAKMVAQIETAMNAIGPPFPGELLIVKIRYLLVELLDLNAQTAIRGHEGAVQKSLEIEEALSALMQLFMENR